MPKMKQTKSQPKTLGLWLIDKFNTEAYRAGKLTGKKHPKRQDIMEALGSTVGRERILNQITELEKLGIIEVVWTNVKTDFKEIIFPIENMDALCGHEGVENPKRQLEQLRQSVLSNIDQTNISWVKEYYKELLDQIEKGNIPENAKDENIFKILNALAVLEHDVWKRKFSSDVLENSKQFEEKYEKRMITVLRDHSPKAVDEMEDYEVLAEHHILNYSQTLEWKGAITYRIRNGNNSSEETMVDTTGMFYGTMLNAQTLGNAEPTSLKSVKKIITIENKANYESMIYDPEALYIYVHGFLSPKERAFLTKLEKIADESMEYYHWSDLDYGGIRIFQFMKKNVFSKVKPLYMDRKTYEAALQKGAGIPVTVEKLTKIKEIDAGELEELKQCILQYGKEIEQENLLE